MSATMTESENTFDFVLKMISKAKNLSVTKCRINGTDDKVTAVKPQTLKDLVAKNILIHFQNSSSATTKSRQLLVPIVP